MRLGTIDCRPVMDSHTGVWECPDGQWEPSAEDCDRCHGIPPKVDPCRKCDWHDGRNAGDAGCLHPLECDR